MASPHKKKKERNNVKFNLAKLVDVVERTAATFAETFIAFEITNQTHLTQLSGLEAAAIAAGIAAGKYAIVQLNAFLGKSGVSASWGS